MFCLKTELILHNKGLLDKGKISNEREREREKEREREIERERERELERKIEVYPLYQRRE